jgi:spermidine/putrescine ABC transporter ATP-binding subunit
MSGPGATALCVPERRPDAPSATRSSLRLRNVAKSYGAVQAVADVSLDVIESEFLTLLGPSGSGKTTLLMMVAGFVPATSGKILLNGRDIASLPPEKRNFGMVFQGYALFPHLTVFENVAFPLKVRGLAAEEIRRRVGDVLDLVQMGEVAGRMPRMLSGGQQQRVALARAIVFDPQVLLLDEPLGALDRQLRTELQDELRALHKRLGSTFICVTHDQEEAMSMSDRAVVLRAGHIIQIGCPQDLYQRPATLFVARFFGESNVLSGRCVGARDGFALVEIGGRTLHTGGAAHAGPALLALRPERVGLADRRPTSFDGLALRARVHNVTFMGSDLRVQVETELGSLIARVRADEPVAARLGDGELWVQCPRTALWRVREDE